MAIRDARCINCGSLIQIDNKNEKSHCLFCNCVFDTTEGLRALENPESFDFPNDPQPEYTGELLTQQTRVQAAPAAIPQQRRREKPFEPKVKEIPSLKIPSRTKIFIVLSIVAVIGIMSAILFPTLAKRNSRHESISAKFLDEIADYNVDGDNIDIQNVASNYVVLVLSELPASDDAVAIFDKFCTVRADVMDLDQNSFKDTRSSVTMRIASSSGGIIIKEPADDNAIADAAAKLLP